MALLQEGPADERCVRPRRLLSHVARHGPARPAGPLRACARQLCQRHERAPKVFVGGEPQVGLHDTANRMQAAVGRPRAPQLGRRRRQAAHRGPLPLRRERCRHQDLARRHQARPQDDQRARLRRVPRRGGLPRLGRTHRRADRRVHPRLGPLRKRPHQLVPHGRQQRPDGRARFAAPRARRWRAPRGRLVRHAPHHRRTDLRPHSHAGREGRTHDAAAAARRPPQPIQGRRRCKVCRCRCLNSLRHV
mmetsp:Transcript_21378/g.45074  ORF Transcript_21378/g.45074 Transcript_21378/m.45074 type:complete len:248 (-) Transcript_21378:394-1137(-)